MPLFGMNSTPSFEYACSCRVLLNHSLHNHSLRTSRASALGLQLSGQQDFVLQLSVAWRHHGNQEFSLPSMQLYQPRQTCVSFTLILENKDQKQANTLYKLSELLA